jgi:hypothetical protein
MINLLVNCWKIIINETKFIQVIFTLRNSECPTVTFNDKVSPASNEVKYLGLIFDKRLIWSSHLKQQRKQVNFRLYLLRPLLKSKLSIINKVTIYKAICQMWLYCIQIWGSSKSSNTRNLLAFQSIFLRLMTSAPWYVTNKNLHKDLNLPSLDDLAKSYCTKFFYKLHTDSNSKIILSYTHLQKT